MARSERTVTVRMRRRAVEDVHRLESGWYSLITEPRSSSGCGKRIDSPARSSHRTLKTSRRLSLIRSPAKRSTSSTKPETGVPANPPRRGSLSSRRGKTTNTTTATSIEPTAVSTTVRRSCEENRRPATRSVPSGEPSRSVETSCRSMATRIVPMP